ncbi:E3 ubiquitin/ISG15 ligase TRIM25-like isoform X2 [Pseudophryne corroboree]|uniref:E3 ubiquitin/ISG15 ligase TRIM25-like isoform X2 n=1 Tax=Pseudophryne corroboree TaxID=495146 RepID=UPI0030814059
MAQTLEDMAEELTCSICLGLFSVPVTIPCGHNFCYNCLDLTWKDAIVSVYSCPQCRCSFLDKPELRKNTLLSNLVSQVALARDKEEKEAELEEESEQQERPAPVMCDSCRKTAASKTCLTCMASFCQEHLLPHLESPAFLDHTLSQPLGDLRERKCGEHNKLIDHYCQSHSKCICCYCVLSHKQCQTYTLQEGKKQKEMHYVNLLRSLNQKLEKATSTIEEVRCEQRKVLDITKKKKDLVEEEFEEIKGLIDEERKKAMAKVQEEEKKVTQKFSYTQSVLNKKKQEYQDLKSKVQSILEEQDDLQFLKKASKVKDTVSKEPFKPYTGFDDRLMQNIYKEAVSLKEAIKSKLSQPVETPESRPQATPTKKIHEADLAAATDESSKSIPPPLMKSFEEKQRKKSKPRKPPQTPQSASSVPESRDQLLKYAAKLTLNPNTAHKKVGMSDGFTKMFVSDSFLNYQDSPVRFVSCSQVLCSQGFSEGTHYWEVNKEGGNFSGIGVAYQSIPRSGTASRLGRNKVSWCIEWCNGKLQAWHNDKETDLTVPNTSKFGVLLSYDQGLVSFFCIGKKFSQIYRFRAQFTEPVYPAFWLFSSPTLLALTPAY